jgi:hypothetical protein
MSDESPRVAGSPSASDLDAFLLEFPSEEADRVDASLEARTDDAAAATRPPDQRTEKPEEPTPAVERAAAHAADGHATRAAATITEFPVHAARPAAPSAAALMQNQVTLLELLERQGGLDWRRAVAVVHQICEQLKGQAPHAPIVIDARNIMVTQEGAVRLLPSQPGGDPLVIQLGRLLRTILRGNEAPPELRLLLAQATFELPIFESVDDVDRALQQLERFEAGAENGKAFPGPVVLPRSSSDADRGREATHTVRPILPRQSQTGRFKRQSSANSIRFRYGMQLALAVIVGALASGLLLNQTGWLWPAAPTAAAARPAAVPSEPTTPATTPSQPVREAEAAPTSGAAVVLPAPSLPRTQARVDTPRAPEPLRPEQPRPLDARILPAPVSRITVAPPAPAVSPRESERRAAALVAQGQTAEAAMVFDSLLLANPLYEPKPSEVTPEALATFRTSQRLLLPNIAQRDYDRGRAALAAGEADRALALGKEAIAILDRRVAEPNPTLRDQVQSLLEEAAIASAAVDEIVYSPSDKGVVPPRELSRQFPASSPIGVPPHRVGTLEMIIDRQGGVEFVKLHTPLNRYHERMIVSAAKAWRYRPATRGGKPVKFRLTVKINLPESGTDY